MNKRQRIAIALFLLFALILSGQEKDQPSMLNDYFKEMATAARKSRRLWNKDLYGPIMLVDPETRQIYANMPDSLGELKPHKGIYTGTLPPTQQIANTHIRWNGTDWAIVMLPLPENKYDRISLLAHERFHALQPELGFTPQGGRNDDDCIHLDSKDARISLRLELEALKQALSAQVKTEITRHLTAAFIFRQYRHTLFPEAKQKENSLELNEGLAEYTGEASCGRPEREKAEHFTAYIDQFMQNPTFVRSFAYQTIPVYGYLLDKSRKGWNKSINLQTNLTDFFMEAFGIRPPAGLEAEAVLSQWAGSYNGAAIMSEERKREEDHQKQIADYKRRFIEDPHFEITFEQMKIRFDPRNIMALENKGTVYPTIDVIDNWGALHVSKGALMSPDWKKITITTPHNMEGKQLSGDGWTLELTEGYSVIIIDRNFRIKKTE
ncbi:MAG: hypothetical protein LBS05_06450 [Tannerellaceae bacterium]|jgi:hypothetical protein|nr:hypothetical protein [Tannerellaceae bacterium]